MQDYLEGLNDAQRSAVVETEGPSLVIAGAGSGKTRVLTFRIAHLLQQGVKPYRVLALTFTNKAAREMKERIGSVVGQGIAGSLWMGTFHSIFARILRFESKHLGYPSSFTIYDTQDSKNLIKSIVKRMKLNEKAYKPGSVLSRISAAKNDLVTPVVYARDVNRTAHDKASQMPMIYEIYAQYMKECYKSGAMDFDDLLLNTNILFRDFPDVLKKYQDQFDYVMVDEYQDTNYSQYLIIKKLAEKHQNICVVGDDAQSIYSFRGAKIENILNFRNDYPGYKLFKLEQNYRSSQNIVNAANSIIAKNKGQIQKNVFSANDEGSRVRVLKAYSDVEEGFLITNDIFERRMKEHCEYKDFAILYRTNAQSRVFEEALRKKNLPYKIYGGLSFYQRKEIKDLLAYFRLTINPADQEALKRVINYPARGIGKTTMDKLTAAADNSDKSLWNVLINPNITQLGINAGTQKKLAGFVALIAQFKAQLENLSAYELAAEIASASGIMKDLHNDKSIEGQGRIDNIDELLNGIKEFTETRQEEGEAAQLVNFLEDVALLTDQDNDKADDINKVTLMTIHSAKGLEFKNVYIVGVEEGLFPATQSTDSEKNLEEERRLFYVAVTRAETNATISFARSRYKYGELTYSRPSRFIGDIDQAFLDINPEDFVGNERPQPSFRKPLGSQPSPTLKPRIRMNYTSSGAGAEKPKLKFQSSNTNGLQAGMKVEHERFGVGEVISIEGVEPNVKATVRFVNAGQKQLLLKFAKLKILN
ncbi:UvrD-helicase domain-containing protein [Carboxylicivirga sediminis]|uniref:DNA 3'-5' helicase n=1 Tax=Carboxylicivirga sediminis TaxID=2006564 RepID=A0A941F2N9_9BACT|nr:UvrD-helicase domain-containing protein [Carboxylicivirga sediminis]MBR8534829.1 UvrD-helicase domain-containing protein [Carboxylicivirga sediminis]